MARSDEHVRSGRAHHPINELIATPLLRRALPQTTPFLSRGCLFSCAARGKAHVSTTGTPS